ncbi:putative CRAL-TRIO lipid binding domain, CRAL/TRIO domain, CRAL/TRIO domain superfamily [Helianthus annuus]|uniref:CRAL-TRIO lipid binding domain, CRAL/TRIO domain, CRAL/TRIO domain superfamily n=1 Tax=Helianthus annuus TaxID=4232 RepID=A0A251V9A7_HELAN|nr:SEC14 cytosolic factor [Helianthus annuus]KAF5815102.1 putative CRAL-TRIO lipid binding domain, CRAL/TRIO domain, CRAL/TRIO domain superfamily [Helianthus annuus]KAJ0944353.1 putative CRAL-TRIO lipid binding domain, CRAL/TRIO domain, CRAL/TRIO domain superfamily [Helianthus annuus]
MVIITQDMIQQFQNLMEASDEPLKITFENLHQGYPTETMIRFLKARDGNISKAHSMLVDCLKWRTENEIDKILSKPIIPAEFYRSVRDSQLIGMSGYTKDGRPVIAVGVGLSTYDKASIHYYVQSHIQINEYRDRVILPSATKKFERHISTCVKVLDMTGLKLSHLNQIKLLTVISSIDDLNYPEKTDTYYIVNAPYVFSACWKVVKPLLQERTRKKVQVLSGCGKDDLLKIMDYESLPHFCRRQGSGSSRYSRNSTDEDCCFSLDHGFHRQLYNYINQQAAGIKPRAPLKQASFHVGFPEPNPTGCKIVQTIETEFHKLENQNQFTGEQNEVKTNGYEHQKETNA